MSVFEKQNFSRLLIWKLNTKIQYHPHPFLSWISPHSSYSPYPPSTILDSSECLQNENCLHSLQGAEQNKIVSFIIYIFKIGLIDCNFKLRVHPTVVIVASLARWSVFCPESSGSSRGWLQKSAMFCCRPTGSLAVSQNFLPFALTCSDFCWRSYFFYQQQFYFFHSPPLPPNFLSLPNPTPH